MGRTVGAGRSYDIRGRLVELDGVVVERDLDLLVGSVSRRELEIREDRLLTTSVLYHIVVIVAKMLKGEI